MPVLLERYFSTEIESKTTKEDKQSKYSAILSRRERTWVEESAIFQRLTYFDMHTRNDSTKFSKMAAIGGTVAQEHCGGFSFENCKRLGHLGEQHLSKVTFHPFHMFNYSSGMPYWRKWAQNCPLLEKLVLRFAGLSSRFA